MRNKEKKMGIKEKVLEKLIETDDYISGEDMAEQLGVTRAAVWKAIKSLTEEDELNIEAVRKVGYRLLDNKRKLLSRTLDSDKIAEYLANDDNFTLARIEAYRKTDSTNLEARRLASEMTGFVQNHEKSRDMLIVATEQTAGRGRLGRRFYSPEGCGLYMSLLLHPTASAWESTFITTAAAAAAARVIDRLIGRKAMIKWVNDIYIGDRKVCGILTEAQLGLETGRLEYAVLGMGFNLFEPEGGYPPETGHAGAIFGESDDKTAIPEDIFNRFAAEITREFYKLYHQNPASGRQLDPESYLEEYRARNYLAGKEVMVYPTASADNDGMTEFPAEVIGIDDEFSLIVRKKDGSEAKLASGEVTLKF